MPLDHSHDAGGKAFRVKNAFYGTMYMYSKDPSYRRSWLLFVATVELLTMLSFAFELVVETANKDAQRGIGDLQHSFLGWLIMADKAVWTSGEALLTFLYTVALSLACGLIALFVHAAFLADSEKQNHNGILLRLFRLCGSLCSTVLFVPILSLLFQTFKSGTHGRWIVSGSLNCFEGGHIVLATIGFILIPLFILISAILTSMGNFTRDIQGVGIDSKTHGLGDLIILTGKALLSLVFSLLVGEITPWIPLVLLFATAISYVGTYIMYMPHNNFKANEIQAGFGAVFCFAAIGSLACLTDHTYNPSILLALGLPLAGIIGGMVCRLRHSTILTKSMDEVHSHADLSIWARKRLSLYLSLHSQYPTERNITTNSHDYSFAAMMDYVQARAVDQEEVDETAGKGCSSDKPRIIHNSLNSLQNDVELAYRSMVDRYPENCVALLEAASFFQHYHDNHYLELTTLHLAHKTCRALDAQFRVYQRLRALREGEKSASTGHRVTAVDRVLFDAEWKHACDEETRVHKIVYKLWQTLSSPKPDLADMHHYARAFFESLAKAEHRYQTCLKINPESSTALRSFGNFLVTTKGEADKADEYFKKADSLDEAFSVVRQRKIPRFFFDHKVSDFDANDEMSAVITISGETSSIGEILEANTAASKVFGRPRSDILGSNVNIVVPKPLSWVHDDYLIRFAKSGRSVVLNTTRALLGVDASGAMIPLLMHFKETPASPEDENTAPRLSAVMISPKTEENLLLFDNASNAYRILSADRSSLNQLLGVSGEQLDEQEILMSEFITEFETEAESSIDDEEYKHQELRQRQRSFRRLETEENKQKLRRQRSPSNEHASELGSGRSKPRSFMQVDEGGSPSFSVENSDKFLHQLVSRSNHTEIQVENTHAGFSSILARIQIIPVKDYGTTYLLAWKPTKQKVEHSETANSTKGTNIAHFNVSSHQECPFMNKSASDTTQVRTMPGSSMLPGTVTQPSDVTSPGETSTLNQHTTSTAPNEDEAPEISATKPPEEYGDTSSARGGTSVTKLLQHMIDAKTGETNTSVKRLMRSVIGVVLLYIIVAVLTWILLNQAMNNATDDHKSVSAGHMRLTSYAAVQSSLLQSHLTNSQFDGTVSNSGELWEHLLERITRFSEESASARITVEDVGGAPHIHDISRQYEIVDKFNKESSTLSVNLLRDFTLSHLREIKKDYTIGDLKPGNTVHSAVLLFDNKDVTEQAFNSSSLQRRRTLRNSMDTLTSTIIRVTVPVLLIFLLGLGGASWYYFHQVSSLENQILKAFLYLSSMEVGKLADMAAGILRQHLERVTKSDFVEDNESDASSEDSEVDLDNASGQGSLLGNQAENGREEGNLFTFKNSILEGKTNEKKGEGQHYLTESHTYHDSSASSQQYTQSPHDNFQQQSENWNIRPFQDSSRFVSWSLVRYLGPAIIVVAWIVVVSVSATTAAKNVKRESERTLLLEQSVTGWLLYQHYLATYALRLSYPNATIGGASASDTQTAKEMVSLLRAVSLERMSILVDGGETLEGNSIDPIPRSTNSFDLLANNACGVFADRESLKKSCEKTELRNGLQAFVRKYISDGLQLLADLPGTDKRNNEALQQLENSPDLQSRLKAFHEALFPLPMTISDQIAENMIDASQSAVSSALLSQQIATAVAVIIFFFLSLFVTVPVIKEAGHALTAAFQLLALLPDEILSSNRPLRQEIRKLSRTVNSAEEETDAAMLLAVHKED